jgi:molecular chaperone DnaK (HSP70)
MARVIGFDFGTTNSLISVIEGDTCYSFLDKDSVLPHPSVISYQGSQTIIGRKAKERLSTAGTGVMGNIVKSPKSLLGQNKVYVEGVARSPKEMVAAIVGFVKQDAQDQEPGDYDAAVVTIPVDMNGPRRRELREAFHIAGINIVQFIHEPLAALYGHLRANENFEEELQRLDRELVLVFDWGGGTLDLTLCQIVDGMLVQIMNDGCSNVGGDVIDDIISNEIVQRLLKQRNIEEMLPIQPEARQRLLDRAERMKIELSEKDKASIFLPNYFQTEKFDPDIEYFLGRQELENMVNEKIELGIQRIHAILEKAGINPASIALCLATGGMVGMPLIQSRLREIFGPQRLNVSERGNTIISEGAAWIAHDKANLSLAKNVELLVARDSYFPAIKAGVQMPREGDVQKSELLSMYCTDPRDGIAKFQIMAPKKPGRNIQKTDERDILSNFSVEVDSKADPLFERIELQINIDENLILNVSAKSLIKGDEDNVEIHNLEFGLSLPSLNKKNDSHESISFEQQNEGRVVGSINIRANVTESQSNGLVPGELLYQKNPYYFDQRNRVPEIQQQEKLYYTPCSYCGRVANHPLCHCSGDSRNYI